MRILVTLGGNALLRRGSPMTVAEQRAAINGAAVQLARETGGRAVIGWLDDLDGLIAGTSGTTVAAQPGSVRRS